MTGWISLHRSIENHWLYQEDRVFSKFEAWLHLLLVANHKDNKVTIGNQLVEVKRGQKLTSVLTLSDLWVWSRTKTNSFLELLKKDNMIDIKKTSKYTLITIVNYDFYQSDEGRKKHQIEHQKDIKKTSTEHQKDIKKTSTEHQKDTNNNDNNVNNENKDNNDNKQQSVFSFYQDNGFGVLQPFIADQISGWLDDFGSNGNDIIIAALKEALKNNKVNWNYTNGILKNWHQKGYQSISDIEAAKVQKQHQTEDDETTKRQRQYVDALENNFKLPENLDDLPF
ncbi:hypothetical protein GH126_05040 [Staphylococcus pseudintermedius]|nr:hypothetical protein [Staphylococcus pseudintermedius]